MADGGLLVSLFLFVDFVGSACWKRWSLLFWNFLQCLSFCIVFALDVVTWNENVSIHIFGVSGPRKAWRHG